MPKQNNELALVLSGGGARAAYQVGFLSSLARHFPELNIPILTGVSAGAINAAFLANHPGTFPEAVTDLADMWESLSIDQVFCVDSWNLAKLIARWGINLVSGGCNLVPAVHGLVDPSPLQRLLRQRMLHSDGRLAGIDDNLRCGRLKALAITGTNYGTGQSVTWVHGKGISSWEHPHRRSAATEITLAHIMASAALPLFFPAVQVGNAWFGDGGIRQAAPLSPALHLGAKRILAISTRYERTLAEADTPVVHGYPPPMQIIGTLMNAIFLDVLDQDARSLELINRLLEKIPSDAPSSPSPVGLFLLRPSCDIGKLSGQFEKQLPKLFRYMVRGIGSHKTGSPDWLSMVLFEPCYIKRMLTIGAADAEARLPDIAALLEEG